MRYLLLILLLLPVNSFGMQGMFNGAGSFASSGTPATIASNTSDGSANRYLDEGNIGNSITLSSSYTFDSLSLYVVSSTTSGTITCRIDDDLDMSSEYLEQVTLAFTTGTTGWVKLSSSTAPTLPSGTIYFKCQSDAHIYAQSGGNGYAGGQYYYGSLDVWSSTSTVSTRDMSFDLMGY